jgi:uncharacterized cupin superfamily protein
VSEARLLEQDGGQRPEGAGWFILNAKEAWWLDGHFGAYTRFEGDESFPEIGINIAVLGPGQPACYYHGEDAQEGFLVLSGECLLLIEGEERPLQAWDFVHCPPWTEHVFVGAGSGRCAILAVGRRPDRGVVYPASDVALRHAAGVEVQTRDPKEAYEGLPPDQPVGYRDSWL